MRRPSDRYVSVQKLTFNLLHGVRLLKNGRPYGDGLLGEFNRLPHRTPGPGGIASLDPQTALQYLTLCVTTIMRP